MSKSAATVLAAAETGGESLAPARAARARSPLPSFAIVLMAFVAAATVCGSAWVFFTSSRVLDSFHQLENQGVQITKPSELESLIWIGRWLLPLTLVLAGGGGMLLKRVGTRYRTYQRVWLQQLGQSENAWQRQEGVLQALLATKEHAEGVLTKDREREREKWQRERANLEAQIADLKHDKTVLEDELNRRQRTEKTLTQQQLQLLRSKDVLELHVQARTQELETLQRRSELILNSAAEGICGFDLQGKVTFANPAAARILALSVPELGGRHAADLFPAFKPNGESVASGNNGYHAAEVVAPRPDGSTFAAEYIRSPIHENGRVVGEVLLFKDITERKEAAEALAQRAAELARSNAELEQFAFVASHDLQEPLRKIQAFGDRLKTKCDEINLVDGRDYLERMQSAAARMRRLIDDLLTFSRAISRTEPFTPVDLGAITREVLGDLEVSIEKSGAQVEVGQLPTIVADPLQIRQLLQNVIGNALKFQPPGAKPVVQIHSRIISHAEVRGQPKLPAHKMAEGVPPPRHDQFCELSIQDNGIGFDEKYLDKIFVVFQRLHGRQEYEGTGVGLAVCRRIVDRHGGTLTAHSKPGEGATFIIALPVQQPSQAKGPT